jgi:hypothetical protein
VAPSVLIAANPYEGELCKKALADIGLRIEMVDSIEGALKQIAESKPVAIIVADGWYEGDARELLVEVRSRDAQLPIFLVEDRGSDIADEVVAVRRGATRLFLRPIDAEALADAVEKLAVEAELAGEVDEQIDAQREGLGTVEMEAMDEEEWKDRPSVKMRRPPLPPVEPAPETAAVPRVRTEVLPGAPIPAAQSDGLGTPPPSASLPIARIATESQLLRADDALADSAGLRIQTLAGQPDFVVQVSDVPLPPRVEPARKPEPAPRGPGFDDRSTIARRLDRELSELERRLFPEAAPAARYRDDDYDDAMSDIDLDSIGIDTLPGIAADQLEPPADRRRNGNGNGNGDAEVPAGATAPLFRLAESPSRVELASAIDHPLPPAPQPALDEEGELADHDVAELMARVFASGFTGRVRFTRGEHEKRLYFDEGAPVFATSSFPNDRLGDLLWREGKLTREQMQKTRELSVEPGRRTAQTLVEMGLLKSSEIFPALRRSVEEIYWSLFGWDGGSYQIGPEQPPPDERVRPSGHTWALILEGVRRKYSLERLLELVGPPEVVLTPTTALDRALGDANLSKAERSAAALFDGERSLSDVTLAMAESPGTALSEAALWALTWGLHAVGALRAGGGSEQAVRSASTLVSGPSFDRRQGARNGETTEGDRTVDRERLLAKRAQIADCDYFSVLGVDRQASTHEIDRAWERLRGDFAPERFPSELRSELDGAFVEIREVLDEAHRVLRDDAMRRAYREHLVD